MKTMIFSMIAAWLIHSSSIYNLQFQDVDGNSVPMNQFQGKKILLVNIATQSSRAGQLGELQQLHEQYGDSVVILAFPSNSFGREHRSNQGIREFCQTQYGVTYTIASKNPVTGPQIQPLYHWLTSLSENGMMGDEVRADYQKFLINESGVLIGVFAPSVGPMSQQLINALTN